MIDISAQLFSVYDTYPVVHNKIAGNNVTGAPGCRGCGSPRSAALDGEILVGRGHARVTKLHAPVPVQHVLQLVANEIISATAFLLPAGRRHSARLSLSQPIQPPPRGSGWVLFLWEFPPVGTGCAIDAADRVVGKLDKRLRTVFGGTAASRENPAGALEEGDASFIQYPDSVCTKLVASISKEDPVHIRHVDDGFPRNTVDIALELQPHGPFPPKKFCIRSGD